MGFPFRVWPLGTRVSSWHGGRFSPIRVQSNSASGKYRFKALPNLRQEQNHYGPGKYLLLIIPATTFGLGVWQTQRLSWKSKLIQELSDKTQAPPIDLPETLTDINGLEYQRVKVRGRFDHTRPTFIGPRSLLTSDETSAGGLISSNSTAGWHVIMPFQLSDRPETILVNRGWVSKYHLDPKLLADQSSQDEVDVVGVVRTTEPRQQFQPKNSFRDNKWLSRDVEKLAAYLNTDPIFIDACDSVPNGPVGGQTRVTLRNDHLSYLLTWFSLAAATTYMWIKKFALK
ncbi:hypothetical protein TCAL_00782 [Tigriopus californicus]|uniref:SURF1-like protein n=1 Tax=Tigriopus californicus TaxID=6832 RepID=A0A553NEZ1_TIGCA|nr:surfeit locus protein 1-like [Tigriopus californicus]TRY64006.1 hypothetical protein TCAL_00782 [Tigriopus californicus]|eukprot:TCALIF_00782-PA protein Name:"Similar to SURF1 Surfeit locus protein 1 (Homo sapiens)" AED:0.18 eAED:0.18 QI:5/0/0/0.83/0.6/0.83/6/0/285